MSAPTTPTGVHRIVPSRPISSAIFSGVATTASRPPPRSPIRDVPITEGPIRLGQFLKLAGLADDGGHARALLEAGEVLLNGRVEQRRGTQLQPGDVVAVGQARARPTVSGQ